MALQTLKTIALDLALKGESDPGGVPCPVEDNFDGTAPGWRVGSGNTCETGTFVRGRPTEQRANWAWLLQVECDHTSGLGNAYFTGVNTD